ncbi:MAG: PD-(D/E)XK nuclease family protein [Armatimonadetes bacterium]|nr:PD-(D/E)XK nuclease family protein [Armatimonadota bacterium]
MVYTGVGSRETPAEVIALMEALAQHLANEGYELRSGGADGADAAFERGCVAAGGKKTIFLPAPGWNRRLLHPDYVVPPFSPASLIASRFHPGWSYLSTFVKKLHARNVNQVLGEYLHSPTDFVVCWTPDGAITTEETSARTGGTGQAIRIASAYGIPIYNLQREDHLQLVKEWVAGTKKSTDTMRTFKLSPSDFAFLWKECKRCYWLKYTQGIARPYAPMAKIFNTIDGAMQKFFQDQVLSDIDPSLPRIKVIGKNITCTSEAMVFDDLDVQVYVHGKTDGIAEDLDNGGYCIIDHKTSMPKPENLVIYSAQLHSYAYAFTKNAENATSFSPVNRLGLLVYEPQAFATEGLEATLNGSLTWAELPLDKKWFRNMLHEVATVLAQPEAPLAAEKCPYCSYVDAMDLAKSQVSTA